MINNKVMPEIEVITEIEDKNAQVSALDLQCTNIKGYALLKNGFQSDCELHIMQTIVDILFKKIKDNLTDHIKKYDEFNSGMEAFRDKITTDVEAFLIVTPVALQFRSSHPPGGIAVDLLDACTRALNLHPTASRVLSYIYGLEGIANHFTSSPPGKVPAVGQCETQDLCKKIRPLISNAYLVA